MTAIIFNLILGIICFAGFILISKLIYFICLLNFLRVIAGVLFILFSLLFLCIGEWKTAGILFGLSLEFIRKFYLYTQGKAFQTHKKHTNNAIGMLITPVAFILKGGIKVGQYAVSIIDGTVSAKQKLKKERAEFENEKAWFEDEKRKLQEENEKIMRAWEELFKAREEFEQRKNGGSSSEKQDHSQHKSYQEQKKQYEESKRKEHKQKTGRLFQEWAKFDLENPANNKAHEVLGTSPNSTPSEIKKAYYALAKKWMPDTLKHWAKTTEEMEEGLKIAQMINIAYEKIGKGR